MKHDLKNNPNLAVSDYSKSSRQRSIWFWVGVVVIGVFLVIGVLYLIYAGGGFG